jgi:hypothetical protein
MRQNGDFWHSKFRDFLVTLADRRRDHVKKWILYNTVEFSGNINVQKFLLEKILALA